MYINALSFSPFDISLFGGKGTTNLFRRAVVHAYKIPGVPNRIPLRYLVVDHGCQNP